METAVCPGAEKVDPRVRRTRKLIEEAFRSLIAERPFSQISVADITERATVNRATFYAHFEDKEHLATTMLRAELAEALRARLCPDDPLDASTLLNAAETVFEGIGRILSACPKQADEFSPTVTATLQETIQLFIGHWLERDPRAVRAFPGASKEAVATVIAWSLFGAAVGWSKQAKRPPARQAAQEVVALLYR